MLRALLHYGIAVLSVGLALLITGFTPLNGLGPTALFYAAVMLSSWYGGLGPGLFATGLSVLAIDFFVMAPAFALVLDFGDLSRVAVFVAEAYLISWLNNRRKRLSESLHRQTQELIAAHRYKDEFLAALGHELRNPLATILNGLQVLRQFRGDDATTRELCEIGEHQVRHMSRLIEDLLDVTRIAQGKVQLRKQAVDLGKLVDEAVAASRPLIDRRGHELTVTLPPQEICLEADPTRLQQVLVNLLQNAAKYTDPGGRIWLTATHEGQELIIRVRDTGVGIAPELLASVFDRYSQSQASLDRSQGGLGIGLSLVRALVELHAGRVEVHSDGPGQGTEFIVHLPCHDSPRPDADQSDEPTVADDATAVPAAWSRS